ncbi:MAG: hypothetical protein K2Q26_04460 [Bdellovibrionales bacterium]|nr:hypothetical protein [Bdellovibrionales bacterium]
MNNLLRLAAFYSLFILSFQAHAQHCGFPPRQTNEAWSSQTFLSYLKNPSVQRELAVVKEVLKGNVPEVLKAFTPLRIPARYQGADVVLELQVQPDYLMIGTENDFVRMPLTNYAAQFLASEFGFVMPTTFLVDRIYDQASVKLKPQPTDWYKYPGAMRSGPNYYIFNNTIENQRDGRWGLVAGHKKDVVITNRLNSKPQQVAIYGWQQAGNKPIQPLALPHDFAYEDYSHGIRFLGPELKIIYGDGRVVSRSLAKALTENELGNILNGQQGPITDVRSARVCDANFANPLGMTGSCPQQPHLCGLN